MTVYVAEIKGRGIAAFHANNGSDAERLVRDRVFRDDFMVLATGGLPLWDGVTDIEVRLARPDEEVKWRASRAKAIRQGNIEENDVGWIAFLVALTITPTIPKITSSHRRTSVTKATIHPSSSFLCFWSERVHTSYCQSISSWFRRSHVRHRSTRMSFSTRNTT
jgi:hypothetical protein